MLCLLLSVSLLSVLAIETEGQSVFLSLGSTNIITNNTKIFMNDIGENYYWDGPSLTCHTDLVACCRNSDTGGNGGRGEWRYPNGSLLLNGAGSAAARENLYFVRNAPQVIRLARRNRYDDSLTPTGSYCCTVPTTQGVMTFCASLQLIMCQSLPALINGIISYSDPTLGLYTRATYSCDPGYILNGRSVRDCGRNKEWDGSAPTCQASNVTCPDLPDLVNGDITYNYNAETPDSRPVNTLATHSCHPSYALNGGSIRNCGRNGLWSGSSLTCQLVVCSDLDLTNGEIEYIAGLIISWPVSSSATFINSNWPVNSLATFHCNDGYVISGISTRTCQNNGIWNGVPSNCIATCPDLGVLTDGIINYYPNTSLRTEGTVAIYICLSGYVPSSSMVSRTCLSNGTWIGGAITCQLPPVYVSLGNTSYAAMSAHVPIDIIGETNEAALVCHTDNFMCCRDQDGFAAGEWINPNGGIVSRAVDSNDSVPIVSTRGSAVLRLHRRGSVSMPTGSYCCVIPDNIGVMQTLCVQLVKENIQSTLVTTMSLTTPPSGPLTAPAPNQEGCTSPTCDVTIPVVGGVVAVMAVLIIVAGVVMVTYLVVKHKRVVPLSVPNEVRLNNQGHSLQTHTIPDVYEEISDLGSNEVKEYTLNEAYFKIDRECAQTETPGAYNN